MFEPCYDLYIIYPGFLHRFYCLVNQFFIQKPCQGFGLSHAGGQSCCQDQSTNTLTTDTLTIMIAIDKAIIIIPVIIFTMIHVLFFHTFSIPCVTYDILIFRHTISATDHTVS